MNVNIKIATDIELSEFADFLNELHMFVINEKRRHMIKDIEVN